MGCKRRPIRSTLAYEYHRLPRSQSITAPQASYFHIVELRDCDERDGDGSAVGVDCIETKGSGSIKRAQKDVSVGEVDATRVTNCPSS